MIWIAMKKRGQQSIGMSFGMIFAIFLIVVFVIIAFIAIKAFLGIQETSEVGMFYDDLQKSIDSAWQSQSSEKTFEIDLPSGITHICFANLTDRVRGDSIFYDDIKDFYLYEANVFLIPPGGAETLKYNTLEHINLQKITYYENPYCVPIEQGLKIKKGFYDRLVVIE
jgi:hypothetical protein